MIYEYDTQACRKKKSRGGANNVPANQSYAGDYIAGLVVAAVGRALSGVPPLAVRRSEWREREMVIS